MKNKLLLLFSLLLIVPLTVLAEVGTDVKTLTATFDDNTISFSGTTQDDSVAVMCKLYDSADKEIDMLSVEVDNKSFTGAFAVTNAGEYEVACANYEGGEIKRTNVTVSVSEPVVETYTVTFNTNGGSEIEPIEVVSGEKVNAPGEPTKGDMIFDGWYEDETLTTSFDFNTPITGNITLYAGWIEDNHEEDEERSTVSFNSTGGSEIEPIEVVSGERVNAPSEPTNGNMIFDGWYEDETLTTSFDFNTPITGNITLYAKWSNPEPDEANYTVTDDAGNIILFTEEDGHDFYLSMIDYLLFTAEDLAEADIPQELYDEVLATISDATKEYGTLLAFYEIEVFDEDDHNIYEGPFNIKIKLTDKMKDYKTFKLIFVEDDFSIDTPITLTREGEYLVGTLPHLSKYALTGSTVEETSGGTSSNNPQTFDNIYMWVSMLFISIIGLSLGIIATKKLKKAKDN